jgi:hypothetical protein
VQGFRKRRRPGRACKAQFAGSQGLRRLDREHQAQSPKSSSSVWPVSGLIKKNPAKAEALKIAYVQESSFKPISAIIPVTMSFGADVESRLYFLKDEDVFEYRLRQRPGEAKTRRNPEFVVKLRRTLEQSPGLSKFARPDAAMSMNGFAGALNDALYLFKHRQCLRLDVNTMTVSDGYPRDIEEVLPGVDFDRIDAALAVAPERIYFFRGC